VPPKRFTYKPILTTIPGIGFGFMTVALSVVLVLPLFYNPHHVHVPMWQTIGLALGVVYLAWWTGFSVLDHGPLVADGDVIHREVLWSGRIWRTVRWADVKRITVFRWEVTEPNRWLVHYRLEFSETHVRWYWRKDGPVSFDTEIQGIHQLLSIANQYVKQYNIPVFDAGINIRWIGGKSGGKQIPSLPDFDSAELKI
jgi:hypothetical protein